MDDTRITDVWFPSRDREPELLFCPPTCPLDAMDDREDGVNDINQSLRPSVTVSKYIALYRREQLPAARRHILDTCDFPFTFTRTCVSHCFHDMSFASNAAAAENTIYIFPFPMWILFVDGQDTVRSCT